jgi:hypothetical protein
MPLLAPEQSCIHVLSSSMYDILTHDYPIEIYISAFHLRHLCIPTRLVKTTHNIKTSLIKQCYTWYAWLGLLGRLSPTMLITAVLLCILLLYCCTTVDVCSILHALCSVLDQYMFHYCIMLKIMLLLNHVLLKLNKSNILSNTWNHSKRSFFIKSLQFQHDMFSNSKHNFIKHKQFQHDMFSTICII